MGHPKFSQEDFLRAALAIIAERGVSGVTVAAVSDRLGSPTGSFYHRFASRDVLLGSLWLRTVLEFQTGISDALDADDGLRAALHTRACRKPIGWRLTENRAMLICNERS